MSEQDVQVPTFQYGVKIDRSTKGARAKNRAISDLIGLGEVSAEEIEADDAKTMSEAERLAREKAKAMGHGGKLA